MLWPPNYYHLFHSRKSPRAAAVSNVATGDEGDDDGMWTQKLTRSKKTLVRSEKGRAGGRNNPMIIDDDNDGDDDDGTGQGDPVGDFRKRSHTRLTNEDPPKEGGRRDRSPERKSSKGKSPKSTVIAIGGAESKTSPSTSPSKKARSSPKKTASPQKDGQSRSNPHPLPNPLSSSSPTKASPAKKFNYREYLQKRSTGPIAPGSKEIPQGAPNCLLGLAFVFTGELESLSREEAQDLVKRYGGRTTTAPSGRTDYVIVGADAGASKLDKVRALGLKTLTEDGLLDLIRSTSVGARETAHSSATTCHPEDGRDSGSAKIAPHSPVKKLPKLSIAPTHTAAEGMWTEKYAPQKEADLIGNHTSYEKLVHWLQGWNDHPPTGAERAVLISGPPGIGKTTAAHMACKRLALEAVEMNASDTRSKSSLHEHVREMIDNRSMAGYDFFAHAKENKSSSALASSKPNASSFRKQVLIMDEVDGMSAGDRGGMAELIQLIKKSRIPIICICNDRASPKVRSLANYCLDLRFRRPDARQVAPRISAIAREEGLHLGPNVVEELVASTQGDIRQILTLLSTYRLGEGDGGSVSLDYDQGKRLAGEAKKDIDLGPFDAAPALLGAGYARMSLSDRIDMYFVDSSLVPLMVQENYLRAKANTARDIVRSNGPATSACGSGKSASFMDLAAAAADSISEADLVDNLIRGANQEWGLAPLHAVISCVRPAYYCHGSMSGRVEFASWLGQNSKAGKNQRLLGEITKHAYLADGGCSRQEMRLAVLPVLARRLLGPLQTRGVEGVDETIGLLDAYSFSRDDFDSILELTLDASCSMAAYGKVPTAVKTAFTRRYNQGTHRLPYSLDSAPVVRRIKTAEEDAGDVGEAEEEAVEAAEEKDDEDISKDKMIKVKTSTGAGNGGKKALSGRGRGRGRARK